MKLGEDMGLTLRREHYTAFLAYPPYRAPYTQDTYQEHEVTICRILGSESDDIPERAFLQFVLDRQTITIRSPPMRAHILSQT